MCMMQTTSVIVFPNPATAQISMSGMTEGDRYEIFSSTGVLVDAGIWTGDPVEITDRPVACTFEGHS